MDLNSGVAVVVLVLLRASILTGAWTLQQDEQEQLENAVEHEGTVLSAGVDREETVDRRDPDNDGQYESREREVAFVPRIRRYTYQGQQYESDSIYSLPAGVRRPFRGGELHQPVPRGRDGQRVRQRETPRSPFWSASSPAGRSCCSPRCSRACSG